MNILLIVFSAACLSVFPYLLGCSNGALLVSKYILRKDIRNLGSGNAGLTNFYRVFGGKLTLLVIFLDVLKAVISVLLGGLGAVLLARSGIDVLEPIQGKYIASLFCELGHMFPFMFGFKGGKGILSGGVIAIMLSWKIALVVWGSFLILACLTRYVSLGSISTGFLFPIAGYFVYHDVLCTVIALIIGALIVWQHRGNIQRLLSGTESKFTLHRKE